jgi:hypothetical protein
MFKGFVREDGYCNPVVDVGVDDGGNDNDASIIFDNWCPFIIMESLNE